MAKLCCLVLVLAFVTSWPVANVVHAQLCSLTQSQAENNADTNIDDQVQLLHQTDLESLGNCNGDLATAFAFDKWQDGTWFVSDPCRQFCWVNKGNSFTRECPRGDALEADAGTHRWVGTVFFALTALLVFLMLRLVSKWKRDITEAKGRMGSRPNTQTGLGTQIDTNPTINEQL